MVKIGEAQKTKRMKIEGKFINFTEIGGI